MDDKGVHVIPLQHSWDTDTKIIGNCQKTTGIVVPAKFFLWVLKVFLWKAISFWAEVLKPCTNVRISCKTHSPTSVELDGFKAGWYKWSSELSNTMFSHKGHGWIPEAPLKSNISLSAFSFASSMPSLTNRMWTSVSTRSCSPNRPSNGCRKWRIASLTFADIFPGNFPTTEDLARPKVNQSWSTPKPGPCLMAQ